MVPCVDKSHGGIELAGVSFKNFLRIFGKRPDPSRSAQAAHGNWHKNGFLGNGFGPDGFGHESDLMAPLDQRPGQVCDISLSPSAVGVDIAIVEGNSHEWLASRTGVEAFALSFLAFSFTLWRSYRAAFKATIRPAQLRLRLDQPMDRAY